MSVSVLSNVLGALVLGSIARAWDEGPVNADNPPGPSIQGRVIDEQDLPIPDAIVRLYQRRRFRDHLDGPFEETRTDAWGRFSCTHEAISDRLERDATEGSELVLIVVHPLVAIGWDIVQESEHTFDRDIVLTKPVDRTVQVVSGQGEPIADATVEVTHFGTASAGSKLFDAIVSLGFESRPLSVTTDSSGRATFRRLPNIDFWVRASKAEYAERTTANPVAPIRLVRAAGLEGTVIGVDGKPLAGVKVTISAKWNGELHYATTDEGGSYYIDCLKPEEFRLSRKEVHVGEYALWVDDKGFATDAKSVLLHEGAIEPIDLEVRESGVIRVKVIEGETGEPAVGMSIFGSAGHGFQWPPRFSTTTDEQGRATLRTLAGPIELHVGSGPHKTFFEGHFGDYQGWKTQFDFDGKEQEVILKVPPILASLITLYGECPLPAGAPSSVVYVYPDYGRIDLEAAYTYRRPTNRQGKFRIPDAPGGRETFLYAESEDGQFAGAKLFVSPKISDPDERTAIDLQTTVKTTYSVKDRNGTAIRRTRFEVTPMLAGSAMKKRSRIIESDGKGNLAIDRVLPGMTYRIEQVGGRSADRDQAVPPDHFDEVVVLSPMAK